MTAIASAGSAADQLAAALFQQFAAWHNRAYRAPVPEVVKQAVRDHHAFPAATWIELGCGQGDTTALLAARSRMVIAIETDRVAFEAARRRFPEGCAVYLFHARPCDALPELLPQVVGALNVWIHASRPELPQDGAGDSLLLPLAEIGNRMADYRGLCLMVDGAAGRAPECADQTRLDLLVDWARRHRLDWQIEHAIFVARSRTG